MVKHGSTCVISKAGTRDPRRKFHSHRMLISGVYSDILSDLNYYCIIYILYYHISDYIIYYIIYLYHLCKSYWKPHPKKVYQVHLGSLGYLEIWPRSQDDPSLYGPVSGPLLCIALACERKPGMGCCVEDPCGEQNSLHVRKPCDVRETSTRDHFLNLASILDFSRYWDSQYLHGIDCP